MEDFREHSTQPRYQVKFESLLGLNGDSKKKQSDEQEMML